MVEDLEEISNSGLRPGQELVNRVLKDLSSYVPPDKRQLLQIYEQLFSDINKPELERLVNEYLISFDLTPLVTAIDEKQDVGPAKYRPTKYHNRRAIMNFENGHYNLLVGLRKDGDADGDLLMIIGIPEFPVPDLEGKVNLVLDNGQEPKTYPIGKGNIVKLRFTDIGLGTYTATLQLVKNPNPT